MGSCVEDCVDDCCKNCISGTLMLLMMGSVLIWLGPSQPKCSIEKLYIPALDKASNDPQTMNTTTISFHVAFWNNMDYRELYCNNTNVTFYYGANLSSPIGSTSIPEVAIKEKEVAYVGEVIQTRGVPWEDVRRKVSNGSTAVFRVELDTQFRASSNIRHLLPEFIAYFLPLSKRHGMGIGANINVNDHGKSVVKLDWLSSKAAPVHVTDCVRVSIIAVVVLVLPILL
ncbi:protein NDR1-like [Papaver somniferum]|uniref:protein NDR1-like n=1 Tax=Papaver somniferum TaxID=3469 RepID=UPI000E702D07|nr:protein NDR1-like [Papaver somniferum]